MKRGGQLIELVPGRPVVHLICHAHLDPVWLWQWEDGLTEAISTFKIACDFCEREPGFIFCHNEALLYRWVEEHAPRLFARIRKLVRAGRWHIAGGSFLQPDLVMPNGESLVRQFLVGKTYFKDKFGVEPTVAYNFDSFGQPEGLPQILAGCGFEGYIFCRPDESLWRLPANVFRWRDRSGSEVVARRAENYPTRGNAFSQLERFMPRQASEQDRMFLWGIGNHGGGPSRADLRGIRKYARAHPELAVVHSTPERHFRRYLENRSQLAVHSGEMMNIFPGCYTSLSRVKRAHRSCESLVTSTERMAAMAWWLGRSDYPVKEMAEAWRSLLFCEFHDVLPGSCIQSVERDALAMLGHCEETARRARAGTFIRLLDGEPPARPQTVPIFVWNPHGFASCADLESAFTYSHINVKAGMIAIDVRDAASGRRVVFQREAPEAAIGSDWQMKIAAQMALGPFEMRRLEVHWKMRRAPRPWRAPRAIARLKRVSTRTLAAELDPATGLVNFAAPGARVPSFLAPGAFQPVMFRDLENAWTCGAPARLKECAKHALGMPPWEAPAAKFTPAGPRDLEAIVPQPCTSAGSGKKSRRLETLRVIEDGPVRRVFETVLAAGRSAIVRRYVISKLHGWIEIRDRIFWNETNAMLKIALPLAFKAAGTVAESPYGAVSRPAQKFHVDFANQRWVAAAERLDGAPEGRYCAALNTGSYGHSIFNNTLYLNVLRSPVYSAMRLRPEHDEHTLRHWPRQDQGEHEARFRILFGRGLDEAVLSRAAQEMNTPPQWMVYFPPGPRSGQGIAPVCSRFLSVSGGAVQLAALKKTEKGDGLVVRLWNPSPRPARARVEMRNDRFGFEAPLGPHALKTFVLEKKRGRVVSRETDLIENPVKKSVCG